MSISGDQEIDPRGDQPSDDSEIEFGRGESASFQDKAILLSPNFEPLRETPTSSRERQPIDKSPRQLFDIADGGDSSISDIRDSRSENQKKDGVDWKLIAIDTKSSSGQSIASWKSIISAVGRRLEPLASSTPLVRGYGETGLKKNVDSTSNSKSAAAIRRTPANSCSATALIEEDDDESVIYYGAPGPGTSTERREAIFRDAFSTDGEISTPIAERVQEAPSNLSGFVPKLTSTADDSQKLNLSTADLLPASPIL